MELKVGDKVRIKQNCPVYGYRGKEGKIIKIDVYDWETLITVKFPKKIKCSFFHVDKQVFNSVYIENFNVWSVS